MREATDWYFLVQDPDDTEAFLAYIRAIQADALASACNAIARIDRATLSLAAGEFNLQGWRDAKAALAVAEQTVRRLTPSGAAAPGTTDSSSGEKA
jgi:hypothetical protein